MQDIHPIKSPVMVGLDPALVKMILLIAGSLVLLIVVIFLAVWFWKSRSQKAEQALIPVIPPYTLALKELDRLGQTPVVDPRAFYFDLGSLVKRYIGSSYTMNALEMTTQELVRQIRFTKMDKILTQNVARFLIVSDPFRYGPAVPGAEQVTKDLAAARQLITGLEADLESRRALSESVSSKPIMSKAVLSKGQKEEGA
jgi:hypothetical protein